MAAAFFNTPEKSVVSLFHDPPGACLSSMPSATWGVLAPPGWSETDMQSLGLRVPFQPVCPKGRGQHPCRCAGALAKGVGARVGQGLPLLEGSCCLRR